jgi:hypothetical protein
VRGKADLSEDGGPREGTGTFVGSAVGLWRLR